jgi:HD-GYP domain-containing protein (c-di-GMP phosphodiesterase class II)
VLESRREFDRKELRDICILAMLHDIGAYKTEEIDKMVVFETTDVWNHSIYGYLFLHYFSPIKELAEVILFHHAECDELGYLDNPEHQVLSQLISLCDRADVFILHKGSAGDFRNYIEKNRDKKFRGDIIDMFLESGINIDNILDGIDSDEAFRQLLYDTPMTDEAVNQYMKMIVLMIDFRSRYTVIHTIVTTCVAKFLARLLGVGENEIEEIKTGSMLHDIGKIGISVNILEKPGRLSDDEMEIMRTHVDITNKIIKGSVNDSIRLIAVRHHEKLDGTGYPKQLNGDNIDSFERIVAVADILSALYGKRSYKEAFPKEKIFATMNGMSENNLLDPEIVKLVTEHFDEIIQEINREAKPIEQVYNDMNEEYISKSEEIKSKYKKHMF